MQFANIIGKARMLKTFGNSMEPVLRDSDVVLLRKESLSRIGVNDIVTVQKKGKTLTHRVIYTAPTYLVTKGDANHTSDGKILARQLLGKMYEVKRDGRVFSPETLYLLQSTLYFREIVSVSRAFRKASVDFVILKGLPLHLYNERAHPRRLYLDCDLLISSRDWERATKTLRNLGYKRARQTFSRNDVTDETRAEVTFHKEIKGFPIVFDVHREVVFMMTQLGKLNALYPYRLVEQLTEEFLRERRTVIIQNHSFPILSSSHLILYLALHFFHHNYQGIHRLDLLAKLMEKAKSSMIEDVGAKAVAYNLVHFVYPSFFLLEKYFPKTNRGLSKVLKPHVAPQTLLFIQNTILRKSVFDDEPRIAAGIHRFKLLFFLSPHPLPWKLAVFFSPSVLRSIAWAISLKIRQLL